MQQHRMCSSKTGNIVPRLQLTRIYPCAPLLKRATFLRQFSQQWFTSLVIFCTRPFLLLKPLSFLLEKMAKYYRSATLSLLTLHGGCGADWAEWYFTKVCANERTQQIVPRYNFLPQYAIIFKTGRDIKLVFLLSLTTSSSFPPEACWTQGCLLQRRAFLFVSLVLFVRVRPATGVKLNQPNAGLMISQ